MSVSTYNSPLYLCIFPLKSKTGFLITTPEGRKKDAYPRGHASDTDQRLSEDGLSVFGPGKIADALDESIEDNETDTIT